MQNYFNISQENPFVINYDIFNDHLEKVQNSQILVLPPNNNLTRDKHVSEIVSRANAVLWCIIRYLGHKAPLGAKRTA